MKITDADIIKTGEQELIDGITADLDWGAVEEIFRKEHKLSIDEDIEFKNGDIIAHNNKIAYQLEFQVKVGLSILLDREGNYISVSIEGNENQKETDDNQRSLKEGEYKNKEDEQHDSEEKYSPDFLVSETSGHPDDSSDDGNNSNDEYKDAMAELEETVTLPNDDLINAAS